MSDTPPVVSDADTTCPLCAWEPNPPDEINPTPHTIHEHYVIAHGLEPTP